MDKNISALLRNDTKTVRVRFYRDRDASDYERSQRSTSLELGRAMGDEHDLGTKEYTYVTDLSFEVGDLAMVYVTGIPKVVKITVVDPSCQIEPNDDMKYKWISAKIDLSNMEANKKKNAEIEEIIAKNYKANIKNQFRNMLLADVPETERVALLGVIGETR